jgi:2-keto-4-pentenoate hydratase/2-oxohepta-3-ene-1,7-dioic acid hydratase in catechol pathway
MKLALFKTKGESRIGLVHSGEIIDTGDSGLDLPASIPEVLHAGAELRQHLEGLFKSKARRYPLEEVNLQAPVPRPGKFLCVGLNYLDHIEETGNQIPDRPTIFNKQITCVIGPGDAIHKPRVSDKLDYEGELGMVIGRRCRHVAREQAPAVIGGYLIVNDVSVRDWQVHSPTWTMGKSFDTHGPTGPWLVTSDEIDPHSLDIKTWVNDDLRQSSNTRHLLFNCYYLVEYLSTAFTLEPGDIISTGTSSGVGFRMTPRGYMKAGDTVKIEVEGIGVLENPVIEEPASTAFID